VSNPYISKNAMEKIIMQQESRLNATLALLERAVSAGADPDGVYRVENFTKHPGGPRERGVKLQVNYTKETDLLELTVVCETTIEPIEPSDPDMVEALGL
jgi:hypothetical protein